jgi:hypothetical protein
VLPTVEAKHDVPGAGIVSVLNQFFEDAAALGVIAEDLSNSGCEVNLLPEVFPEKIVAVVRRQ